MEHFRVGQDDVGEAFPRFFALVPRGVPVVNGCGRFAAFETGRGFVETQKLVLGQCLEGKQVKGPGVGVGQKMLEQHQVVNQRLPGSGRRGHHNIAPASGQFEGLGLMAVKPFDSNGFKQADQPGRPCFRRCRPPCRDGRKHLVKHHLAAEPLGGFQSLDIRADPCRLIHFAPSSPAAFHTHMPTRR